MATSLCAAPSASVNSPNEPSLLSIGDVVARYSVDFSTIRRAEKSGALTCFKLPSGHRRFHPDQILTWLGQGQKAEETGVSVAGKIPIALIARVSSHKQAAPNEQGESDLTRQVARLYEYIYGRWGKENVEVQEFVDVGSGLNYSRAKFLQFTRLALLGKFRFACATYEDRICRYGKPLVSLIAQHGNCEVVITEQEKPKSFEEEMALDIITLTAVYSNRYASMKARKTVEIQIGEDASLLILSLHKTGASFRKIASTLKAQGIKDEKGREIKWGVIGKFLKKNKGLILSSDDSSASTSYEVLKRFFKETLRVGSGKNKVRQDRLVRLLEEWAAANKVEVPSTRMLHRAVLRSFQKLGVQEATSLETGGVLYSGLTFSKWRNPDRFAQIPATGA